MIRYEGARKDPNGEVLEDTVADELAVQVGEHRTVTAGNVYVTGPGDLARRSQVKRVFHAAATHGAPGGGYRMVENIERCVKGCLDRMDSEFPGELQTIVFPMMGTGEGGADVYAVAPRLVRAAIAYFTTHPDSQVEKVYFAAWNERDLEACRTALATSRDAEPMP
jgi:O-acetyl-ADP-ribose deacetylase (regulator of RNase III)